MTSAEIRTLYKQAAALPCWKELMLDLIAFADATDDGLRALGRHDVIGRILEQTLGEEETE